MKGSYRQPLWLAWACLFFSLSSMSADAQKCPRSFNISSQSVRLVHCKHIGNSGATLSWTYNAKEGSILMAFKAKPTSKDGWVAWGINPSSSGIVGTQALLALRQRNGTMFTGLYNVVYRTGSPDAAEFVLRTGQSQDLQFQSQSSEYFHKSITIYATVLLPSNKTTVNQAWQVGFTGGGGIDTLPITDLQSFGTIDLLKGKIPASQGPAPAPGSTPPPSHSPPPSSPPKSPPLPPPSSSPSPSSPPKSPPLPPPPSSSPSPSNPPKSPPLPPPPSSSPSPSSPPKSPPLPPPPSSSPSPSNPPKSPPSSSPSPSSPPKSPPLPPPPSSSPSPPGGITPSPSLSPPSPPSPSPSTPNPPSSPTPAPSINIPPPPSSPSFSPSSPNPPSSPAPTPSIPGGGATPFSPSPSPSPNAGENNANVHLTISTITFSFISLLTTFACTIFSTM